MSWDDATALQSGRQSKTLSQKKKREKKNMQRGDWWCQAPHVGAELSLQYSPGRSRVKCMYSLWGDAREGGWATNFPSIQISLPLPGGVEIRSITKMESLLLKVRKQQAWERSRIPTQWSSGGWCWEHCRAKGMILSECVAPRHPAFRTVFTYKAYICVYVCSTLMEIDYVHGNTHKNNTVKKEIKSK